MKPQISALQAEALAMAHQHGKLVRHVGGYWTFEGCPRNHNGVPDEHFGTSTIEASSCETAFATPNGRKAAGAGSRSRSG